MRGISTFFVAQPLKQVIPFAQYSWSGWFLWALISFYVVKLYHPSVADETPLDQKRIVVGWIALAVFILCFSFSPFTVSI
jgi:hypothetical protein